MQFPQRVTVYDVPARRYALSEPDSRPALYSQRDQGEAM